RRLPDRAAADRRGEARRDGPVRGEHRLRDLVRRDTRDAPQHPARDARVRAARHPLGGARARCGPARPPVAGRVRRPADPGRGMGVLGCAAASAFSQWGIARSTASNAALLIVVEPLALMLASPFYLGERLSRREAVGAALAVVGTVLVVVNGIPGVTEKLVPHWQGDLLPVLSGVAYAAYWLLGRRVLDRHAPLGVTTRSLAWGTAGILPIVVAEWASGARPLWTVPAVAGTLYLALVISALGYVAWNWALARVSAPR